MDGREIFSLSSLATSRRAAMLLVGWLEAGERVEGDDRRWFKAVRNKSAGGGTFRPFEFDLWDNETGVKMRETGLVCSALVPHSHSSAEAHIAPNNKHEKDSALLLTTGSMYRLGALKTPWNHRRALITTITKVFKVRDSEMWDTPRLQRSYSRFRFAVPAPRCDI